MKFASIAFIGAGHLTYNLTKGLLKQGYDPSSIIVSSRGQEKLSQLTKELKVRQAKSNQEAAASADMIILSVTPPVVQPVCLEIAPQLTKKSCIISLASAINIADIRHWLSPHTPSITRVMTNIAVRVGKGTSVMFGENCSETQKTQTEAIFNAVGRSFWVPNEADIRTLTPLVGCGPAYVCLFLEALQKAAIAHHIPAALAQEITLDVFNGAIQLAKQSSQSAEALLQQVTTPQGITEAALNPLFKQSIFASSEASYASGLARFDALEKEFKTKTSENTPEPPCLGSQS